MLQPSLPEQPSRAQTDVGSAPLPFAMRRLGTVMAPDPALPEEDMGVLNPGAVRGRDGALYLFPRIVAAGNYSRVGRARVRFDAHGTPVGAERLGYVLEPTAEYERNPSTGGGCEDPRITFIPAIDRFVMTYAAFGPTGPRIAIAVSDDLVTWRRLGVLRFTGARVDFSRYGNKDASFFPEPVSDPNGRPSLAILHRPTYREHRADGSERIVLPRQIHDARESVWISYVDLARAKHDEAALIHVHENHLLLSPTAPWEQIKLGAGPPPIVCRFGWLLVYHGIRPLLQADSTPAPRGEYAAGVAILDRQRPWHVLYRSPRPTLRPEADGERAGVVSNVVFPTGLDPRHDLGDGIVDVYYGMADTRIGAARFQIPRQLPLRLQRQHAHLPAAVTAPADERDVAPPRLVPPPLSSDA